MMLSCPVWAGDAYKSARGPASVGVVEDISLPSDDRDVSLRVSYPIGNGGPYPVVVLSHGGGCAGGSYSLVGDHWASHGYVVIQPTHPDSISNGFDMAAVDPRRMEGIIRQRVTDMSAVLDGIGELETLVPDLVGRVDAERVVASGHSMGGATALLATGMVLENPFSKQRVDSQETRYDALLLLSEPGHNPTLPKEPWRSVSVPTFIYTGTNDYGSESGETTRIPFEYAIVNQTEDGEAPKHHLWVDDVDHYLSGGWCRTQESYDDEAASILNGVSTAFLDAYTKQDVEAMKLLRSGDLPPAAGTRPKLTSP